MVEYEGACFQIFLNIERYFLYDVAALTVYFSSHKLFNETDNDDVYNVVSLCRIAES